MKSLRLFAIGYLLSPAFISVAFGRMRVFLFVIGNMLSFLLLASKVWREEWSRIDADKTEGLNPVLSLCQYSESSSSS